MKKYVACLLLACMGMSLLAALPLTVGAESTRLSTDKTVYAPGEPIMVTATGEGKDWVGLYCAEDSYDPNAGGVASIYWYYVAQDGHASGDAVNLCGADYNNFVDRPSFAAGLPAGDYKVVLMANDGYEVIESVTVTITDGESTTPDDGGASEDELLATDKTVYTEGDPVLVRARGEGKDWVGIYEESDTYPAIGSIYWYYVADYAAGEAVNIRGICEVGQTQKDLGREGLPAGRYKIILFANDGYEVLARIDITVEPGADSVPVAPRSVNYTSANAGKGRADGKLAITYAGSAPQAYLLQWANASGPIKGYTDIATVACTGVSTEYTMTPNTLIPEGADRILVYAVRGTLRSEKPATAMLPKGAGDYDFGTVHQELQVMSDIHINSDSNHIYNKNFTAALQEIAKLSPNTSGVFINGDIGDQGLSSNYAAYQRILKTAGKDLRVVAAIGNHDFFGPTHGGPQMTDAECIAQFLKGTNNDSETVYFSRVIDGTLFVFLGSEARKSPNAELSQTQLDWLETTLAENQAKGRPVFLFLHEGIMNTVAGTFEYQGWHGVWQGEALREILSDHPEVVMFSGHSHWELESPVSFLPTDGKKASHLNTASCAYLWDDNANKTNVGIEGSQGYYIYLYDNHIVFRGRNFSTGEWISSAQFVMDWDFADAWETEEETQADTDPATDPATNPATDPEVTDAPAVPETDTDTAPAATGTTDDDAAPSDQGCASVLPAFAWLLLLPAVAVWRKKH